MSVSGVVIFNAYHIDLMRFFCLMTEPICYFDILETPNERASFIMLVLFSECI